MSPRVLILRAPGTNCDEESAHAFALAGGVPQRWHVNRLLESPDKANEFQILCLPGGFSYGDDIAAGRILGNQIEHHLADTLREFRDAGKLIIGICNGFQILLKTDLLLPQRDGSPQATLAANESGKFEDRWVRLAVTRTADGGGKCVFLAGIEELELPIAHGEGRFVPRDDQVLDAAKANGQLVLKYKADTSPVPYPANPNGAIDDVAGLCDITGRVFGLMPHPERYIDPTQHPNWTRATKPQPGEGLRLFQNAVRFFS